MSKFENPLAFPCANETDYQAGMTLRDWFAGQVLPVAAGERVAGVEPWMMAKVCYDLADAMLAERAKDGEA